jgi:hypothetical protein
MNTFKEGRCVKSRVKSLLLWLFVINLGIACGAGLYEARVVIPQWANSPPQTWPNTGLMFWVYVTTIPLTVLTVANLITAWMDGSTRRQWWLSAAATIVLERIATFSYFIPTMIGLTSSELPEAEVKATLSQWLLFNHGRHVLMLSGWLMALKALSLPSEHRG